MSHQSLCRFQIDPLHDGPGAERVPQAMPSKVWNLGFLYGEFKPFAGIVERFPILGLKHPALLPRAVQGVKRGPARLADRDFSTAPILGYV
jgi:hypothetical protein